MPHNLELKAKYPNIKRAETIAQEISETKAGKLTQTDTYFHVTNGLLKLRECVTGTGKYTELIWYKRNENEGPRISHFERVRIENQQAFITILKHSLEMDVIVEKNRVVYLWNKCRIHIDIVEQLGPYVEFEVMKTRNNDEKERMDYLIEKFGITDLDIINCSYADLARHLK